MVFLYLLRLVLAFSPSYIHPDEHCQNPDISASFLGHIHRDFTYEWALPYPMRSIIPVFLTTGWPFYLVDSLSMLFTGKPASARILFATERLVFVFISFTIDYTVQQLTNKKRLASLLVQSSGLVLTLLLHSFSNSIETSIVGISLLLLKRIDDRLSSGPSAPPPSQLLFWLAFSLVFGIWNRFTFVIFVFVVGVALIISVVRSRHKSTSTITLSGVLSHYSLIDITQKLYPAIIGGFFAIFIMISIDSLYFGQLVITPLNAALFNISNSGQFGVHPLWQHFLINMPGIFMPYMFGFLLTLINIKLCKDLILQSSVAYIVLTVTILTANPHKEARFLLSLLIPFILLCSSAVPQSPMLYKFGKFLILGHAIGLVFVYCCVYRVGTLQAVFEFNKHIEHPNTVISANCVEGIEVIYWKVSWPPNYLMFSGAIPECQDTILSSNHDKTPREEFLRYLQEERKAPVRYVLAELWEVRNSDMQEALLNSGLRLEPVFDKYFGPDLLNIPKHGYMGACYAWFEVSRPKEDR